MGWLKDFREYRSGLANPSGLLLEALGTSSTFSGEKVSVQKAMELSAVRAAVEIIAKAVGILCPLKVYRIVNDDEREEARSHRTWRMLHDQPNPVTTSSSFWMAIAADLLIYENAYIYKERDPITDEVESLWIRDPNCIEVIWDGVSKSYVYTAGAQRVKYTSEEILHIPGFSTDGIYGASRIDQAKQTLGTAISRARFEANFYRQGARVAGVLEHPGRLGEKGVQNVSEQFNKWHSGAGNMHKVPVLEEGMKFSGVSMSLLDMQFAELAQQTRTEIAVLFNIPPAYLGGTTGDSLTYATTESNQIQFAQLAVAPLTTLIGKAISSDPALLPWNVMYAEFSLEGLYRADAKTRAEYWKAMKDLGVVDEAYIASRENLPKPPKPKPVPVMQDPNAPPGALPQPAIPPKMAAMQNALKNAS
jgi:HK97 family phage portal protein